MIVLDMDAPKSCTNCPCTTEDFGETRCVLGSPDIDWNERPCTCPMINADGLISREEVLRYISHKNCIESEEMLRGKEPCEDAISRQAMLDGLASIAKVKAKSDAQKSLMGRVMFFTEQLPPITLTPLECEDAVSRDAVNALYYKYHASLATHVYEFGEELKALPPVAPKPRTGHWINITNKNATVIAVRCDCCGKSPKHAIKSVFCPNCGVQMEEEQE